MSQTPRAKKKTGRPRTSLRPQTGRAIARYWHDLDGRICELCVSAAAKDRHHIDGDPLNNDSENIAYLCRRCHMVVDGRLGQRRGHRKTHCKHGHEFTPENTYMTPAGGQSCRTCRRAVDRKLYAKRKAAA